MAFELGAHDWKRTLTVTQIWNRVMNFGIGFLPATKKTYNTDVSPRRSAMTTKMTAGVDVTGRPSLVVDCQRGRSVTEE